MEVQYFSYVKNVCFTHLCVRKDSPEGDDTAGGGRGGVGGSNFSGGTDFCPGWDPSSMYLVLSS